MNKQYFLWYLILLPLHLPRSTLLQRRPRTGGAALALWVAAQAAWLREAYGLEFLGRSTFVPGLWLASLAFFLVNCGILGVIALLTPNLNLFWSFGLFGKIVVLVCPSSPPNYLPRILIAISSFSTFIRRVWHYGNKIYRDDKMAVERVNSILKHIAPGSSLAHM